MEKSSQRSTLVPYIILSLNGRHGVSHHAPNYGLTLSPVGGGAGDALYSKKCRLCLLKSLMRWLLTRTGYVQAAYYGRYTFAYLTCKGLAWYVSGAKLVQSVNDWTVEGRSHLDRIVKAYVLSPLVGLRLLGCYGKLSWLSESLMYIIESSMWGRQNANHTEVYR